MDGLSPCVNATHGCSLQICSSEEGSLGDSEVESQELEISNLLISQW